MIMVPCRAAWQNVVQLTWFRSIRQRVWCRGFWLRGLGRSCGKPWQLLPRGVCKDATCLGNLRKQIASYAAPRKTVHTAKWNKKSCAIYLLLWAAGVLFCRFCNNSCSCLSRTHHCHFVQRYANSQHVISKKDGRPSIKLYKLYMDQCHPSCWSWYIDYIKHACK